MTIKLLASDFDGTMVPLKADPLCSPDFKTYWRQLPQQPLLVLNSGRMIHDLQEAAQLAGTPKVDFFIGGVGTEMTTGTGEIVSGWQDIMQTNYDRSDIDTYIKQHTDATPQPEHYQSAFKSSWYWYDRSAAEINELENALRTRGHTMQIVYSSSRDLDIIPVQANKGHALAWLCHHLQVPLSQVIVAGDTGNDIALFEQPSTRGIVVNNARNELKEAAKRLSNEIFFATKNDAAGIQEGLQHFESA